MAGIGCEECGQNFASMFCICQYTPSYLCNICVQTHTERFQASFHDFCEITDVARMEKLSFQVFRQKKLATRQAMMLTDMLIQKEEHDFKEIENFLNLLFTQSLQLVSSMHSALTTEMQDIKTRLQQSLYVDTSPEIVEHMLGNLHTLQCDQMSLFDVPVLRALLSAQPAMEAMCSSFTTFNFTQHILAKMKCSSASIVTLDSSNEESKEDRYCPVVMGNILRKYYGSEPSRVGLTVLAYSPQVDQESSYTFMDDGQIFVCGGTRGQKTAYLIGANSPRVTILPEMSIGRACSGVICFKGTPYAFGGSNGQSLLMTCEKFASLERWEMSRELMARPRSAFTPCLYNNLIYLAGGFSTKLIEEFDPARESFTTLPALLAEDGKAISFVIDSDLIILHKATVYSTDLAQGAKKLQKRGTVQVPEMWSPATPVVDGRRALFWSFEELSVMSLFRSLVNKRHGICYSFNADTMKIKQDDRFEYIFSS